MAGATSAQASIHIDASPHDVYQLISDMPRVGEWSPECYRCEWVDADGPAAGARFKGYNKVGLLRWTANGRVTVAEPGREFTFATIKGAREETRWRYVLTAADGGTDVTESYEFVWGPWYILLADVFIPRDRQLQQGMRTTLERIKVAAEEATRRA
ncbi:MAG TPA: SRPBCC family protein [Acidimicrobiia bacterium]|nr:SRPBCC family protein [Acidimicrobiia bacterium]